MILAAGRGTRLGPLGLDLPKVLVDVGGEPLLARQLGYLERHGVRRVVINAHHHSDAIEAFAADYTGGTDLTVVVEETLLGTAGGVRNAKEHLGDRAFFVLYGDVMIDQALMPIMESHVRSDALATLTVYRTQHIEGKGTVTVDCAGRISRFLEKQTEVSGAGPALVNAGLYVIEPRMLGHIEPGVECDFGHDVFPAALARGEPLNTFILDDPVIDVGTPEGLALARARAA
jgi:NDP-sugar pyrophosphorylase family protein